MVLNFAHRGSLTEAPENTIPAIKKAVEHNAKGIEIDIQLSKDGHIVVIHDHHFSRFNQKAGLVNEYTLEEIKQIDIGSAFSKGFAGEAAATLDEALEIVPEYTLLNIEIKNIPIIYENIENKLVECLEKHNRKQNILVSSFDHIALAKFQKLAPAIPIGMLFHYPLIKPWDYAVNSGLDVTSIHPNRVFLNKELIDGCHTHGYEVYPYTVNKLEEYKQFVEWGVDGVFSNNPKLFGGGII
ncbi:hypothetical protein JYK21_08870 [Ralstonia pickettii]|nr:hypothetical protein [Ralstonia pickettii]